MKKLFYIIDWPLLFVAGQFLIILVMTLIFIASNNLSGTQLELSTWIGSEDYVLSLARFLENYGIIILALSFLFFFPIFYKKYHKEVLFSKKKMEFLDFIFLFLLGFSFGLIYNCILLNIHQLFPLPNLFGDTNTNLLLACFGTIIVGPILEEYLFRGIVYHRLQKFFSIMKSLLLTGVVFALFHQNVFQIIYAFIFNFILIFAYEKFNDIKAPIIVHMGGNLVSVLVLPFLQSDLFLLEFVLMVAVILLLGAYIALNSEKFT